MVIRHKDPQIGLLNLRLMDDILFDFRVGARTPLLRELDPLLG